MSKELKPCEHDKTKYGVLDGLTDYELCLDCGMSRAIDEQVDYDWQLNEYALQQEYLISSKLLSDRTGSAITALIEKYGDPQYKTNEFAIYDLISVAQQLQAALAKPPWISVEDLPAFMTESAYPPSDKQWLTKYFVLEHEALAGDVVILTAAEIWLKEDSEAESYMPIPPLPAEKGDK